MKACTCCIRNMPIMPEPKGFIQSPQVAKGLWTSVSVKFIVEIPVSNKYNAIMVVAD